MKTLKSYEKFFESKITNLSELNRIFLEYVTDESLEELENYLKNDKYDNINKESSFYNKNGLILMYNVYPVLFLFSFKEYEYLKIAIKYADVNLMGKHNPLLYYLYTAHERDQQNNILNELFHMVLMKAKWFTNGFDFLENIVSLKRN